MVGPSGSPDAGAMTTSTLPARPSVAALAAATPSTRERYVDLLRAASILVVVLGHWLMAVIERNDGRIEIGNVIAITPGAWVLTWLLQVMPVFFFVGGFSNAVALDAARRRGTGGYGAWVSSRARRLLRPVGVLLAVWVPLVLVLERTPIASDSLRGALTLVSQPLWFVGIYLVVCALAPPALAFYRRAGVASIVALGALAAVVDVVRFGLGVGAVGYVNFVLVWLFAQQLGFAYADGTLRALGARTLGALAAMGFAGLGALVVFGPYPASMVGLPGDEISNMAPPTFCLVALTVGQVALVMLARDRVSAWLQRPLPWTAVITVNASIMTIFCWHLTAALLVTGALMGAGVAFPVGGTVLWWLTRPLWIAALAGVLVALVAGFGRFERGGPVTTSVPARSRAIVGTVVLIVGLCGVAQGGLTPMFESQAPTLGVIGGAPVLALVEIVAGAALLGIGPLVRSRRS